MYSEGSFFERLFHEFPDVIIRVTSRGVLASGDGFLVAAHEDRPDGDEGLIWDYLQAIPDLM